MAERPGVMLYFDSVRPALNRLDDTQCGQLFRAVVDYAQYGVFPELDTLVGMAFDLLVPKIDRDAEKYEESREQRQYAVYCREKQKAGEPCLKFAEWQLMKSKPPVIGPISPDNGGNGSYPSSAITVSPSVSPSIIPSASISSSAKGAGKGEEEGSKGDGEGEHVHLFREWLSALDEKDNSRACVLSNRLYALGYDVDLQSRELKRR